MNGIPTNLSEYKKYIEIRESHLADYATKSEQAILFDAKTSDEYYREKFDKSEDHVTLDRYRFRTLFQLDRDRILYSSYFLRLAQKTQLFTSQNMLVETRLSHTIRVSQISRSLCMGLRLNQDLAEAIALGHDIGHVPFAHRGERSLANWLNKKIGYENIQPELTIGDDLPVLLKIQPQHREAVRAYFTLGNDPEEEIFMHGRHSFRLLAIKNKEARKGKFTRQVLFGIWRHSLSAKQYDSIFRYKTIDSENNICEISGKDLTPECQVVRYADDISTILDLVEGMENGFVSAKEIQDELNGFAPDEDYLGASIPQLFYDFSRVNVSRLLTYFISDFIGTNLLRLEQGNGAANMSLSERAEKALNILRNITKVRLHSSAPLSRGDKVSESRIYALCDWYDKNPNHLILDIKNKMKEPEFPYVLSQNEFDRILLNNIYKYSIITDFISMLTDQEVRRLSEPL